MSDQDTTRVIEINGVKMEVDLRHAKIIHKNLRVGDRVKLLVSAAYSGAGEVKPGVIVALDMFHDHPTVTVAYLAGYGADCLKFAHVNDTEKSKKEFSMVPAEDFELPLERDDILTRFDRDINKKELEIQELRDRREYFVRNFGKWFEMPEPRTENTTNA